MYMDIMIVILPWQVMLKDLGILSVILWPQLNFNSVAIGRVPLGWWITLSNAF